MPWKMTFARLALFCLLALGFAARAEGGTRDPGTPDAQYLAFGEKFPFVVRVCVERDGQEENGDVFTEHWCASGVVIRKHWVITAAHVVSGGNRAFARDDAKKLYALGKIIAHKGYQPGRVGWDDIALAHSPEPIELEFYPELYRDNNELGQACTFAGFGIHGTFSSEKRVSDKLRRAGHNKIEGAADAVLFCDPSRGPEKFPLEFSITPGDSGGGMFLGNKLAGINSFLLHSDGKGDGTYGDTSAFTRVSLYADWVESQIQKYELALQARATEGPLLHEAN